MQDFFIKTADRNHVLGAGYVLLRSLGSQQWRYLAESSNLSINVQTNRLPLDSVDSPSAIRLADPVVSIQRSGTMSLRQIDSETLAKFVAGQESTFSQDAETAELHTITDVVFGSYYQIGEGHPDAPEWGFRNVTITSILEDTTPLVAGVDFELLPELGMIKFLEDAQDVSEGDTVVITYNVAAHSSAVVTSGEQGSLRGSLRFVANNTEGRNLVYQMPLVDLTALGDMVLKSRDTYQEIPLQFEILDPPGDLDAIIILEPPITP
jgi:hypothetical protein